MLMLRLWNYIRGYVIIVVEGYFLEKFINICIHRQILLWDIKRKDSSVMTLKVSAKAFKMLKPVARKTKCRIRILGKRGVPFRVNRYRRRKAFVLGAFIFIVLLYGLTSFIWTIEVTGNEKIDTQQIIDKLDRLGVKPGILKYSVDTEELADNIILDMNELAWVGISVKGTKVKVDVIERVEPPQLVPNDQPCSIVATKDGIIKSVVTKAGQELVKAGDTVTKGQVLVSGVVKNKNEELPPRQVHAIASVKARTWYEKSCPVNMTIVEKKKSGQSKAHYSLVLFTKKINLFPSKVRYEDYDRVEVKKQLSIGKDLVLPFEFIIERFYENNLNEKTLQVDEAKKIAADKAKKEVLKDLPQGAKVVNTRVDFVEDGGGGLLANVIVECLEEIGTEEKIGGE